MTLPKPKIGDILEMIDVFEHEPNYKVKVLAVFDSLDQDWGDFGEAAWAQHDVNAHTGMTGEWYAVVCFSDDTKTKENGTWSCASYEVSNA